MLFRQAEAGIVEQRGGWNAIGLGRSLVLATQGDLRKQCSKTSSMNIATSKPKGQIDNIFIKTEPSKSKGLNYLHYFTE